MSDTEIHAGPSFTLAGMLDVIRAHADLDGPRFNPNFTCDVHVSRLVAALEAILALHGPGRFTILGSLCARHESHRFFSITRTEAAGVEACPDCPASVYVSCSGCGPQMRLDSCPDRAAITAALTGQD